jgi:phage I-like protein
MLDFLQIVAIVGVLIGMLAGCGHPVTTVQAMPNRTVEIGTNDEGDDEFIIFDLPHLYSVASAVNALATPLPILFSHGQDDRHTASAAGFISVCRVDGSGMYCDFSWTQYGRDEACGGSWRFASPSTLVRMSPRKNFFYPTTMNEISLTNLPRIKGMAPVPVPSCLAFPWQRPQLGGAR